MKPLPPGEGEVFLNPFPPGGGRSGWGGRRGKLPVPIRFCPLAARHRLPSPCARERRSRGSGLLWQGCLAAYVLEDIQEAAEEVPRILDLAVIGL